MNKAQAPSTYPRPARGITTREVLAAIDRDHAMHTIVGFNDDKVTCSCGEIFILTDEAAFHLEVEPCDVEAVLRARVPGQVTA